MTRLESGGLVLRKDWTPLQEVVGSSLHHLDRRLNGRPVITHLAPDLPLIQLDGVAMEQVLVNVIDNAIEYTPADAAIEISAAVCNQRLDIDIADRGPGLPPGDEERIFQKFFRASPNNTQRGTGLGLAISRGIVEAHDGTISAINRPGGGALFRISLPMTQSPPAVQNLD
jgi:two-component system sensor histidine kinase KdpD